MEDFRVLTQAGRRPPPSIAHDALENVDALFRGDGVQLPSTVILDYFYGIAAYNAWRSKDRDDGFNEIKAYRDEHYVGIPALTRAQPDDDADDTPVPDDRKDADYKPSPPPRKRRRNALEETMDELNLYLMYIQGITPEMAAERRQKEVEQEEQAALEANRSKVTEWRNHLDVC